MSLTGWKVFKQFGTRASAGTEQEGWWLPDLTTNLKETLKSEKAARLAQIAESIMGKEEIEEIVELAKCIAQGYPNLKVPTEAAMREWCAVENYLRANNLVLYKEVDETTIPTRHTFDSKAEVRVNLGGFPIKVDSIGAKAAPIVFRLIVNISPNVVDFAHTKISIGMSISWTGAPEVLATLLPTLCL